jgi:hypothetical protein
MILDFLFTILHLIIIVFNLLGWIWTSARRLHLTFVFLTAASWFVLGIWYGIGYCPITDWHWQIKEKLGETNLPNSFIKYFADKITHGNISSDLIDAVTVISFAIAAVLSIYLNFFKKKSQHKLN